MHGKRGIPCTLAQQIVATPRLGKKGYADEGDHIDYSLIETHNEFNKFITVVTDNQGVKDILRDNEAKSLGEVETIYKIDGKEVKPSDSYLVRDSSTPKQVIDKLEELDAEYRLGVNFEVTGNSKDGVYIELIGKQRMKRGLEEILKSENSPVKVTYLADLSTRETKKKSKV